MAAEQTRKRLSKKREQDIQARVEELRAKLAESNRRFALKCAEMQFTPEDTAFYTGLVEKCSQSLLAGFERSCRAR